MRPRIPLFLLGQDVLDWLGGYSDCKIKLDSTYFIIQWHNNGFLYASYGCACQVNATKTSWPRFVFLCKRVNSGFTITH